jgi:hypothetical protein
MVRAMTKTGTHVRTRIPVVVWETPQGNFIMPLDATGTSWTSPVSFVELLGGTCLGVFPAGMAMRRDDSSPFEDSDDVAVRYRRANERSDSFAVVPGFVVDAFTPPPPAPNMDRVRGFLDSIYWRTDLDAEGRAAKSISMIMEDGKLPEPEARAFYADWLKSRGS